MKNTEVTIQNDLQQPVLSSSENFEKYLDEIVPDEILVKSKKIEYFNMPCSFDIETTSFRNEEGIKAACMYEWTLDINGLIIYDRTWKTFIDTINRIIKYFETEYNKRHLVIYVHNLSWEFQFIRKRFNWSKIFATSPYKPLYAITDTGIEFRCSYMLSGYSLEMVGKNLSKYKVNKMVGDLDYSKFRHSDTPMSIKELMYCFNDVRVVECYVRECIENDGNITKIPLTKTGYVRNYCRKECFYDGKPRRYSKKYKAYNNLIKSLHLELAEYQQLQRAFQGGFTHANPFYVGKVMRNVASIDFISSYPYVLVAFMYPMGSAELIEELTKEVFQYSIENYHCIFNVTFYNLLPELLFDNYISLSKCWDLVEPVVSNGRIVSAKRLSITITQLDFDIINKFYRYEHMEVSEFRRYKMNYLPTDFVKSILKLYADKTTLKNVEGKEREYLSGKEKLNSTYGMCVTNVIQNNVEYSEEGWNTKLQSASEAIDKYNNNRNRFLFYPWGIFCTAWARYCLFTGILEFKNDYVYADTDSIKCINYENHLDYIKRYNEAVKEELTKAMNYHNLPFELCEPKTNKGVPKLLGVWDEENIKGKSYAYERFKTLGAKRYMVESEGKLNITVSGLNKKITVPYLTETYEDPFEVFNDSLHIPATYTGKNTHTYIDEEIEGELIDYLGNKGHYHELSYIHLEPAPYDLSISRLFYDYLRDIQTEEIN